MFASVGISCKPSTHVSVGDIQHPTYVLDLSKFTRQSSSPSAPVLCSLPRSHALYTHTERSLLEHDLVARRSGPSSVPGRSSAVFCFSLAPRCGRFFAVLEIRLGCPDSITLFLLGSCSVPVLFLFCSCSVPAPAGVALPLNAAHLESAGSLSSIHTSAAFDSKPREGGALNASHSPESGLCSLHLLSPIFLFLAVAIMETRHE